jgi:hypothetical protein
MRVTNGIPLGCSLILTVGTVNSVQIRKAIEEVLYEDDLEMLQPGAVCGGNGAHQSTDSFESIANYAGVSPSPQVSADEEAEMRLLNSMLSDHTSPSHAQEQCRTPQATTNTSVGGASGGDGSGDHGVLSVEAADDANEDELRPRKFSVSVYRPTKRTAARLTRPPSLTSMDSMDDESESGLGSAASSPTHVDNPMGGGGSRASRVYESSVAVSAPEGEYHDWFHGVVSRREAEQLLDHTPSGTFIFRFAESQRAYSISISVGEPRSRHVKIDCSVEGQYQLRLYGVLLPPITTLSGLS